MSYWHSKLDKYGKGKFLIYYGDRFIARYFMDYGLGYTKFTLEFNSKLWVRVLITSNPHYENEAFVQQAYALLKGTEKHWHHQIPTVVAVKARLKGYRVIIWDERKTK